MDGSGDGVGDACQGDRDGDGIPDDQDASPLSKRIKTTEITENFLHCQTVRFWDRQKRHPKWTVANKEVEFYVFFTCLRVF